MCFYIVYGTVLIGSPVLLCCSEGQKELEDKVENLDPTKDGEACEEPHGAANEAELGLQGHLHIPLNVVIGGRVKIDLDQFHWSILYKRS